MRISAEEEGASNEELAQLYRRYGFLLQRRCRTLLRDSAAADDALQDAFIKIMNATQALHSAENPIAWMYCVVDRCCFDQLRRTKVRRTEAINGDEDRHAVHPGVDVEARDAALRILNQLSEAEYEVAVMAYVDGMSQVEIAAALGLSRPTIWKRLTQVRKRATSILGGEYE